MNAGVLRGYAPLFHQMIVEARPRGMLVRLTCMMIASAAGMMWFSHAVMHSPQVGALICCMAVVGITFAWCAVFASSAVRQNHPSNACLVPRLRRRLITCCVILFAASSVVVACAVGGFFGHFGYALAAAGMVMPFLLFVQRFVGLTFLPSVLFMFSLSLHGQWTERVAAWLLSQHEPAVALLGVAVDIALLAWGVRVAFPRGGERHWAWHHRLQKARAATGKDVTTLLQDRTWSWRPGFARSLRRDCTPSAPAGRMMMHALGPTVREGVHLVPVVGFSLAAVAMLMADVDFRVGGMVLATSLIRMSIVLSVHSYVSVLRSAMAARADEQALYRLTPAAPAAPDFNRIFARAALLGFSKVWLVTVACLAGIDFAATGSPVPGGSTLVLAALLLFFARVPLRDYARCRPDPGNSHMIVGALAAMAAIGIITAIANKYAGFPWWTLAAVIAAIALAVVRERWRDMMRTPPAFPVGRLAA